MYKLSDDDTGLYCTENGLSYGGIPLVAKAGNCFQPCQPEIDRIAKSGLTISANGLQTIANFLNKGELCPAMIGALHLRLPDLPALRLAKVGYDPNEPRDENGMWTSSGGDGSSRTASAAPAGTQYADSGQIINDATSLGPRDKPTASVKGTSGLDINAAVDYLNENAVSYSIGSQHNCAKAVEAALLAGGVNLPKGVVAASAKGPLLLDAGFVQVADRDTSNFIPQRGDVAVIQGYNKKTENGHMTMFNGEEWVSDYHQEGGNDPYPGSYYDAHTPPYVIYRP